MADHDLYNDDYWVGGNGIMQRRQGFFEAMNRLDALARELTAQAHEEYLQRERRKAELEADGETSCC